MIDQVPVMAYYCKLYAVQTGMDLCNKNPGELADKGKAFLMQELGSLEQMKQALGGISKDDALVSVENFVLSVFARTDKEERTIETITKMQAVNFRRAAHFIDVLSIWGPLNEDWVKRRKYCMFKAGDILKCIKAGTQPVRGNPNEPEEQQQVIEQ